jgi:hypothetical protein
MTPEEQAFWDAIFVAAVSMWTPAINVAKGWGIAEFAAIVADNALEERRKRQAQKGPQS